MLKTCARMLRLADDAGPEQVRAAFAKLARRYPPEHFPARFIKIKQCAGLLNLEDAAVKTELDRIAESASVAALFQTLFVDCIPESLQAETPPKVDVAAFFTLLDQQDQQSNLLECLHLEEDGETLYRR